MAKNPLQPPGRWAVIRDLIAFQFKLALDGFRDILLSPVSLALGLFGFIFGGKDPGKHFYSLLRFGHRTDRWINLFGASDHERASAGSSDDLVDRVETMLKDRYTRGGVLRNIKDKADGFLDHVQVQKPDKPDS